MLQESMLPPKVKDIAGQRFGRLFVVEFICLRQSGKYRRAVWRCRCDCGKEADVQGIDLRCGNTKSCGCLVRDTFLEHSVKHGFAIGHPNEFSGAYKSWRSMHQRCSDPNFIGWADYGGRGITVCERWKSFVAFYEDMGERPKGGSLERVDFNGNYEPENCKWIPRSEQSKNTRASRYVELNGERMIQAEAARRLGATPQDVCEWMAGKRKKSRPPGLQAVST